MAKPIQIVIDVDGAGAKSTIDGVSRSLGGLGTQFDDTKGKVGQFGVEVSDALAKTAAAYTFAAAVFYSVERAVVSTSKAALDLDSIMSKLGVGGQNAARQFQFVSDVSNRLGLNVKEAATQFGSLSAAANGTALQGEGSRKIFEAMATAASALHMSNEQMGGSLLALQQMISKGKVSAEELNGQLGERMPGAMQLAARAMDMTTAELMKQMEGGKVLATDLLPKLADELQRTYGETAVTSADSARAAFNRFENSIFTLQTNVANSGLNEILAGAADAMSASIDVFIGKTVEGGTAIDEFKAQADLRAVGHDAAHYTAVMADAVRIAGNEFIIAASAAAEVAQAIMLVAKVAANPLHGKAAWDDYTASIARLNTTIGTAVDGIADTWKITDSVDKSFAKSEATHKEMFERKLKREADFIEEAQKIAARYGMKQGAGEEIQKLANKYGGEIAAQYGSAPEAPTSTGSTSAADAKKAAAHAAAIAAEIQREGDKYDKIIAMGDEADRKGADRIAARLGHELAAMDEERARAEKKGAWSDELTAKFEAAKAEKIQAAQDAVAKITEDNERKRAEIELGFAQARIGWQMENDAAATQLGIATMEAERQRKIDMGAWTFQQESEFQQAKTEAEIAAIDQRFALIGEREAIALERDLAAMDAKQQALIDAGMAQDEAQALIDEQRIARAQETSDRLTAIEQQGEAKKLQIAGGAHRAKMQQMSELDKFAAAARDGDLKGAIDHGAKSIANLTQNNRSMFEINKAARTVQAVMDTYSSATSAYNAMSGIPYVGPVLGAAAAAAAIAAGMANVSAIQSASFGGGAGAGGAVPSPVSSSGAAGSHQTAGGQGADMGGAPPALGQQQQPAQPATSVSITVHALDPSQVSDSTLQGIADKLAAPIQQAFNRNGQNVAIMV